MPDPVLFERRDCVAILTLNRPDQLNALNYATNDLLLAYLDAFEADPKIRAVVLTGAGERAFSAGADITEFSESIERGTEIALRDFVERGQAMTSRLETFPKPVVAAVDGIAYGGGCEITEAVHLAVASDRATFAKPEIRIGIPPTFGGTQRLPRLAGRKRALEHLLTGAPFSAQRALEIGIVNHIVPHQRCLDEALALAARISVFEAGTVAAILAAVTRGLDRPMADGLEVEREQFARIAGSEGTRKALNAWLARS